MGVIGKIGSKILVKTIRPLIINQYKSKLFADDFTIISQNCMGGVFYHDLGLEFKSPTINMTIDGECFVKLVENLEYYMGIRPHCITDCYVEPHNKKMGYPLIGIEDIKCRCIHYRSCDEAINAWERRKKRINWDKIFVIANSWDLFNNSDYMKRIDNCGYKNLIFVNDSTSLKHQININDIGHFWKVDERGKIQPTLMDFVPFSPYRYYEKLFDIISFFNQ